MYLKKGIFGNKINITKKGVLWGDERGVNSPTLRLFVPWVGYILIAVFNFSPKKRKHYFKKSMNFCLVCFSFKKTIWSCRIKNWIALTTESRTFMCMHMSPNIKYGLTFQPKNPKRTHFMAQFYFYIKTLIAHDLKLFF